MNIKKRQDKLKSRFGNALHLEDKGDFYHLTGAVESWEQAVCAGLLCAKKGDRKHLVNDVSVSGQQKPKMIMPEIQDCAIDGKCPDVLIIGGGVTGCAIARELTKENLDILLIEKEYDVALHASSRNDGMVHPGIDIPLGLLKKKLNNQGNALYDKLCLELQIPFQRTGQFLCFKKNWQLPIAMFLIPFWNLTAAGNAHLFTRKKLLKTEPGVSTEAKFAVFFDAVGIVCPYGLTIALAENAIDNGAQVSLDTAVTAMNVVDGNIQSVTTNRGTVYPKLVINAAGVFSEEVAAMAGDQFFSIHPRKGSNAILDKKAHRHINSICTLLGAQSKSAHTKGGGIVSTVDGNVLVGPDAVEVMEKEDFSTCRTSIDATLSKHQHVGNWLSQSDVITYFSGIRAATYEEDFIVEKGRSTHNLVHAAGIQSPGLTAAPAIGLAVEAIVLSLLGDVPKNPDFQPVRQAMVKPKDLSPAARSSLIKANPDYGQIVCRCEEVSKGEILDAMNRCLPCDTVDAIKRRVRAGMGRCQGGFCGQQVISLIAQAKQIPLHKVRKGYAHSEILMEKNGGTHED